MELHPIRFRRSQDRGCIDSKLGELCGRCILVGMTLAPPAEGSPYARHIPALDGIRGFAVLAVMGSHLFPGNVHTTLSRVVGIVLGFGANGVDLFFVLSGFLITGILVETRNDPRFFRNFYARRALRIFPLYYGIVAVYALGALFFRMRYGGQLCSLALYLQNTSLIAPPLYSYAGPSRLPLGHFWSLAVEEQFYLVWPVVIFSLRSRRVVLAACLFFTILCPALRAAFWIGGWSYFSVHVNTFLRADSLLAGGALSLLLRGSAHNRALQIVPWLGIAGALTAVGLMATVTDSARHWWPPLSLSLISTSFNLMFTGLIALVLKPGLTRRIFSVSILRKLGKYSYGLYVFHLLLFSYLQQPARTLIASHFTSNKAVGVALAGLIGFATSLIAAWASFTLYERPFLRLKRFFTYRHLPVKMSDSLDPIRPRAI